MSLKSISILSWDTWFSSRTRTGFSFVPSRNAWWILKSIVINPDGLAPPTGPFHINYSFKSFLEKISISRTKVLGAQVAAEKVTTLIHSAKVTDPSCFVPFIALALLGFWTVVSPISLQFYISAAWKLQQSVTEPNSVMNCVTLVGLKLAAQANVWMNLHGVWWKQQSSVSLHIYLLLINEGFSIKPF